MPRKLTMKPGLPAAARAELLIGHLQDAWIDVAKVLDTIRTYKNHTVVRSDLGFLQEQVYFCTNSLTSLKDDVAWVMAELEVAERPQARRGPGRPMGDVFLRDFSRWANVELNRRFSGDGNRSVRHTAKSKWLTNVRTGTEETELVRAGADTLRKAHRRIELLRRSDPTLDAIASSLLQAIAQDR